MENKSRKYPRLKAYDYSLPGYYYVTIHNEHHAAPLSRICPGDSFEHAAVRLTQAGAVALKQLMSLQDRYKYVRVDKFVIMPTHIHVIVRFLEGEMPRPGLTDVIGAFKSLTTRAINELQKTPGKRQFQRSFYETVIRNEVSYQSCWRYIDANPDRWGIREDPEWDYRVPDETAAKRPDRSSGRNIVVGASPHPTKMGDEHDDT